MSLDWPEYVARHLYGGDNGFSRRERAICEAELRINWTQIASRTHEYPISAKYKQGSGTLRLVRNNNGEILAAGLRLTHKSERGFSISAERVQHHMQILVGICIEQRFLKQRDAGWKQMIHQDDKPTVMYVLVLTNQKLPLISRRVMCLVQGRSS